jgi:hypothetical protein
LQGLVREHRRKIWGDAEVGVEVAGDHRSHAAVALNTGFCSEFHLIEFCGNPISDFFNSIRQQPTSPTCH